MKNCCGFAMKGFLITAQLLLLIEGHATTYYLSSSSGNDNQSASAARNPSTPWQSLAKLNAVFNTLRPGDSILFKKNDTFPGQLNITVSGTNTNPVVLSSYGTGKAPVISGFTAITGWTATKNGIWEAGISPANTSLNMVLVNGVPRAIGRYPNSSVANNGFLTIERTPNSNAITGPLLPAGDWTNADIVIRKTHWVLDRNLVTGISGKTIQYRSESGYAAATGYGFFMQNSAGTLDQLYEWYFTAATHKLGMFFGQATPNGNAVMASSVEKLVTINTQNNITIANLVFNGANTYAFDISQSSNIRLENCSINFTGNTAIHATQSQGLSIEHLSIDYSNNIACDISGTSLIFRNNTISNTGTVAGSGKGDSGSYEALLLSGDNQLIEGNTITATGYIPVTFNGNEVVIRNNFISRFCFLKDDGGGIYTWNNSANAPTHNNRFIDGNIVLDGAGAPGGTADNRKLAHGIYMDDNTDHVIIKNNTVAACSLYGIYIHNAHELQLDSNTSFNNGTQLAMIHDNIAPGIPLRNIDFTNNINFSKTALQTVGLFSTIEDRLSNMGKLDNNYYCRPLDEGSVFSISWKGGGGTYDLSAWQQLYGQDLQSKKAPVGIAPYRINAIKGPNRYANGNFDSNISNLYVYSPGNNAAVSWSRGPLNGGALKLSFSNPSANGQHASIIIAMGSLVAGRRYLLKYDASGAANRYIETYLRKSLAPYNDLSERKLSRVYSSPTTCEVLFTANANEGNTSLGMDITDQTNPVYIDNLQLYEVNATLTNPDDSIHFVYNNTALPASTLLDGAYTDVANRQYAGSIKLMPFRSAVLIKSRLTLLPVRFFSFKAIPYEHTVDLLWTVSNTDPGLRQWVERSVDGRTFIKIGELNAAPAPGTNDYLFTDKNPQTANYYRIRYLGNDGTSQLSKVVFIRFSHAEGNTANEKLKIMPNPATDQLQVMINSKPFKPCTMVLKSISGNTIQTATLLKPATILNISALADGLYSVSVFIDNELLSKRFEKR